MNKFSEKMELFLKNFYNDKKPKPRLPQEVQDEIMDLDIPNARNLNERIWAIMFNQDILGCAVCGKPTAFNGKFYGFKRCCSLKCSANDPYTKEKTKKTLNDKYGGHFMKDPKFIEGFVKLQKENGSYQKGKETLKKNYGVDSVFQLASTKQKIKETNLERYGVENANQNKEIRARGIKTTIDRYGALYNPAKVKETMLARYGVENALKSEEIKNRVRNTCLARYGVGSTLQAEEVREKIKQTNIERYGFPVAMQNKGVSSRSAETRRPLNFQALIERLKEHVTPNFNVDDYIGTSGVKYSWTCVKCNNVFNSCPNDGAIPRCKKCYPVSMRKLETEIREFFENRYSLKSEQDRKILKGKEIDILFKELNLAIEVNGVYWHSDKFKDKNFHYNKSKALIEAGYRHIHIFEDEWANKKDLIIAKVDSLAGVNKKIHARKCEVKEISAKEAKTFILANHLQGWANGPKVNVGLFYENELVGVSTFGKPRFNKQYEWELFRQCFQVGVTIVGGSSKMVKFFELKENPKSLLSYANMNYSSGNVYTQSGFTYIGDTGASYFYVDSINGKKFTRFESSKKALNEKLGTQGLSESECAERLGLIKIEDSGSMIFVKTY